MRPRRFRRTIVAVALLVAAPNHANAGAFTFAGETNGVNVVTHPTGYTGAGAVLNVSVCIDPASPNAAAMEQSVRNVVSTWNALAPASPNLFFSGSNNIGSTQIDFESTALHEVGHCLGLGHPNLSTESGLSGNDQNYTKSADGTDNAYDVDWVYPLVARFGLTAHVRGRREEACMLRRSPRARARRWVVERTHSWINRFRALLVRWDKRTVNYEGALHLACAYIAFARAGLLG